MRIAIATVLVGLALLVAIALGVGALMPGATPSPSPSATPEPSPSATPEPSPSATPEPSATPAPSPTATRSTGSPEPTATGDDPTDLPRFPGARLVEHRQDRHGDLVELELEYRTPARLDRVRRHYRVMLRRHDWFVGDVEFDGDAWEIAANKGSREASIELKRESGGTEVEIEISWPANDRGASSSGSGADDSGPGG